MIQHAPPGGTLASEVTPLQSEARRRQADAALAELGHASTAARRAIVDAMIASGRLETPEQLLHDAREQAPATSLATVYRTLERLDAAGRIKRATLASGAVAYGFCGTGHHEHAICLRCGLLQPIRPCLVSDAPDLAGFQVSSHVLDFYGLCARCASEARGTQPGGAAETDRAPETVSAPIGTSPDAAGRP